MTRKQIILHTISHLMFALIMSAVVDVYSDVYSVFRSRYGIALHETPLPSPSPHSLEAMELIEVARSKVEEGKIAFRHPDEMVLGKTETFEARITQQQQPDSLVQGLKG